MSAVSGTRLAMNIPMILTPGKVCRTWFFTAWKCEARVVHISTNVGQPCEHCAEQTGLDRLAESINHFLERHGYKLLHVGMETTHDSDGKPWHSTVGVVGK